MGKNNLLPKTNPRLNVIQIRKFLLFNIIKVVKRLVFFSCFHIISTQFLRISRQCRILKTLIIPTVTNSVFCSSLLLLLQFYFFKTNPHLRTCLLILEMGRERKRGGGGRERERYIDRYWLPLLCAPNRDRTKT